MHLLPKFAVHFERKAEENWCALTTYIGHLFALKAIPYYEVKSLTIRNQIPQALFMEWLSIWQVQLIGERGTSITGCKGREAWMLFPTLCSRQWLHCSHTFLFSALVQSLPWLQFQHFLGSSFSMVLGRAGHLQLIESHTMEAFLWAPILAW